MAPTIDGSVRLPIGPGSGFTKDGRGIRKSVDASDTLWKRGLQYAIGAGAGPLNRRMVSDEADMLL